MLKMQQLVKQQKVRLKLLMTWLMLSSKKSTTTKNNFSGSLLAYSGVIFVLKWSRIFNTLPFCEQKKPCHKLKSRPEKKFKQQAWFYYACFVVFKLG
jgi:hypothetical protein